MVSFGFWSGTVRISKVDNGPYIAGKSVEANPESGRATLAGVWLSEKPAPTAAKLGSRTGQEHQSSVQPVACFIENLRVVQRFPVSILVQFELAQKHHHQHQNVYV